MYFFVQEHPISSISRFYFWAREYPLMYSLFFFCMFVLCFSHKALFRKQTVSVEKL